MEPPRTEGQMVGAVLAIVIARLEHAGVLTTNDIDKIHAILGIKPPERIQQ